MGSWYPLGPSTQVRSKYDMVGITRTKRCLPSKKNSSPRPSRTSETEVTARCAKLHVLPSCGGLSHVAHLSVHQVEPRNSTTNDVFGGYWMATTSRVALSSIWMLLMFISIGAPSNMLMNHPSPPAGPVTAPLGVRGIPS